MVARIEVMVGTLVRSRPLMLLLALTAGLAIPLIGLPQWVTGPLVNALLVLIALRLGVGEAIVVGMVTPLAAALRGVLPLPLLVMIPFIALGNAALVSVLGALWERGKWAALGLAAAAKFVLLYAAVTWLVARPLSVQVGGVAQAVAMPAAIVEMMRWPQLGTALVGGAIALGADRLWRGR